VWTEQVLRTGGVRGRQRVGACPPISLHTVYLHDRNCNDSRPTPAKYPARARHTRCLESKLPCTSSLLPRCLCR
jgi:hypothetical protein